MSTDRNLPKGPLDHEPDAVTYAREKAGLTKTAVAEACGVSPSLISEIEGGTRNATPTMLDKLARALNCPRVVLVRKSCMNCPAAGMKGLAPLTRAATTTRSRASGPRGSS
jgi:transcriptional regulator with XRE-family HTH domain